MHRIIIISLLLFTFSGLYAQTCEKSFTLFLVGDAGNYSAENPLHKNVFDWIKSYDQNSKGVIFTGNYIASEIAQSASDDFEDLDEAIQLKFLKDFNGKIFFVAGENEWAQGAALGKKMVKWSYKKILKQLKNNEVFIPVPACPGPLEIDINESLVVLLFDTQWWLHPYDTRLGKCDIEDESDVWTALQDALRRNRNKQIVVAGFHPIVSYGETGGHFPAPKSLMPGSLYRKLLGTRSDISHPLYKEMKENLKLILNEFPNVIYASSNEQNFQYVKEDNIHQIICGSLTGNTYLKDRKVKCGSKEAGVSRLDFYSDGRVELNYFALNNLTEPVCQDQLYEFEKRIETIDSSNKTFPDSLVFSASGQYERKKKMHKWLGENYRDIWDKPVKVKVFDIEKEYGGLEIIKRGGGQQTHSIRLEAVDGHQYALRSLEKFVEGALPSEMKNTIAVDLIQDNISASNPYAALAVAKLANAAGVMHTNPQIVYVPNDNRLGQYKEDLANSMFLYEERPNDDWRNEPGFQNSKKIIGTPDVVEKIEDDSKHRVDQKAVLKARLFDTFVNDWDRHDDQWRWASFKKHGKTVYRPIPRDRDQAFYVNQGFLPRLTSMNWLMPKIQGFSPLTPSMRGLTFNARFFDRAFLTEPDWEQWQKTIKILQTDLNDVAIEEAMLAFPKEVRPLCADFTAGILKQRRENWEQMAHTHYLLLAKNVSITGTNMDELFEVKRKNDWETKVTVTSLSNKKHKRKEQIYSRVFKNDETEEVRLYGLNGDDVFLLDGEVNKGIKFRIIGGKGKDSIQNQSKVKALGKQTVVYDLKKNTTLLAGTHTKNKLSGNKEVNNYERLGFRYNLASPGVFVGYNVDDGVFLGGGPVFNQYLFRRQNKYTVLANYAALTNAFNVKLGFDSESEIKGLDHHFGFDYKAPGFALNYFGMGNESVKTGDSKEYYRVKRGLMEFSYGLGYRFGKTAFKSTDDGSLNESNLKAGAFLKRYGNEKKSVNYIGDFQNNKLTMADLQEQRLAGFYAHYAYVNVDKATNPERGIQLALAGKQYFDLNETYNPFLKVSGDFRTYLSFTRNPRTVVAFRLGGEAVFGDNYSFLEAAILSGKTNIRGYWADRFRGKQAVYQNTEIRYKMFDFKSYLLNGEIGVLGFYDSGRVWYNETESGKWHRGYGGGIWISPFDMTILSVTYNMSDEDKMVQVTMNFKF